MGVKGEFDEVSTCSEKILPVIDKHPAVEHQPPAITYDKSGLVAIWRDSWPTMRTAR